MTRSVPTTSSSISNRRIRARPIASLPMATAPMANAPSASAPKASAPMACARVLSLRGSREGKRSGQSAEVRSMEGLGFIAVKCLATGSLKSKEFQEDAHIFDVA